MRTRQALVVLSAAIVVAACSPDEAALPETTAPPTTVDTVTTTLPAPTTTLPPTTTTTPTVAPSTTVAEPGEVEGVVIAVEGGLQVIDSFTILIGSGEQMTFDPAPGLLFGGGPLSHLRDHLADGAPVYVIYTVEPDGTNVAIEVGDAH